MRVTGGTGEPILPINGAPSASQEPIGWDFPSYTVDIQDTLYRSIRHLCASDEFLEVRDVAQALAGGTLESLIGGKLLDSGSKDYDFLCGQLANPLPRISGWTVIVNRAGFPKAVKGDVDPRLSSEELRQYVCVDVTPADGMFHVRTNNLLPTWKHHVEGTPLDVQAALYNIPCEILYAHPAFFKAIHDRVVRPHNIPSLLDYTVRRGKTPLGYVAQKAKQLGYGINPRDGDLLFAPLGNYLLSHPSEALAYVRARVQRAVAATPAKPL